MKKLSSFVTLSIALSLVGCTTRSLPLTTAPMGFASESTPVGTSPTVAPLDDYGTLKLDIRWPERPEYQTQVIPTSTNALIVTLRGPSTTTNNLGPATPGPILVQKTITRQPGATSASETFKLKAANNLSLEVLAYKESAPDYATSKPTARGTGNVNIVRSLDNQAFVTLQSLFAPTITSLSTNFGQPNDTVTLTGDNFGEDGTPLPDVVFGGATASVFTRTSSRSLTVTVPSAAKSGTLSVVLDGVTGTYSGGFWIPSSLTISAAKQPWDTGTSATSRAVLVGQTLQFTATPTWVSTGFGIFGSPPQPTWSCSNPTAGNFATTAGNFGNSGLFTAGSSYATGAITAKYDNGQSSLTSNTLSAVAEDVVVSVETPTNTLGAKGQDSLLLRAFNRLSDGATNSLVTYAASAGVSVDAAGLATGSTSVNGNVQVAVTSQLLTSRVATTSVRVANYVVSTLAGHLTRGSTDGDALTYAELAGPLAIAVDKTTGTTFVAQYSPPLRRIADGQVTTLSLEGMSFYATPQGMDFDAASQTLYLADNTFQRIYKISLTADTTEVATWSILAGEATSDAFSGNTGRYVNAKGTGARFNNPQAVAWDAARQCLYVADRNNKVIRRIDSAGNVTLHAGDPTVIASSTYDLLDGPVETATFRDPCAMTLDPDGNLYVLDAGKLRRVTPNGDVTTLSTSKPIYGSAIYQSRGYSVTGLVRDAAGNLFVCEDYFTNVIDRIAPDGTVTRIAGTGAQTYDPYHGNGSPSLSNGVGTKATFSGPTCLAIDSTGNLYVTDFWNNAVRLLK